MAEHFRLWFHIKIHGKQQSRVVSKVFRENFVFFLLWYRTKFGKTEQISAKLWFHIKIHEKQHLDRFFLALIWKFWHFCNFQCYFLSISKLAEFGKIAKFIPSKRGKKRKKNANSTQCSQAVTHPSTSVIGRELVYSAWYGRWLTVEVN